MDKLNNFKFFLLSSVTAISVATGVCSAGYFIGRAIEHFKTQAPNVTVKGLSERNVKADLAKASLSFTRKAKDLQEVNQQIQQDLKEVIEFCKAQGFNEQEIKKPITSVSLIEEEIKEKDKEGNYQIVGKQKYYEVKCDLALESNRVDEVQNMGGQISILIDKGILINPSFRFRYTKFSDIRLPMIAEATQSARLTAAQFANDSGYKVGTIRSAHQGTFSISAEGEESGSYSYDEARSVYKTVRVVITVDFNLVS